MHLANNNNTCTHFAFQALCLSTQSMFSTNQIFYTCKFQQVTSWATNTFVLLHCFKQCTGFFTVFLQFFHRLPFPLYTSEEKVPNHYQQAFSSALIFLPHLPLRRNVGEEDDNSDQMVIRTRAENLPSFQSSFTAKVN